MKPGRQGMVWVGWAMTIIGCGIVFVWLGLESASTFKSSPMATILGILIVLGLMALLVPVPLILATRRANAQRRVAGWPPTGRTSPGNTGPWLQSDSRDEAG